MAGMKLTGEYEFVDDGVRLVGKVHNTHIPELREKLQPYHEYCIYMGEHRGQLGEPFTVPKTGVFDTWRSGSMFTRKQEADALGIAEKFSNGAITSIEALGFAGIEYRNGASHIMTQRRFVWEDTSGRYPVRRGKTVKTFNAAWVYTVNDNGEFDITLKGLVNRHMLTMLLTSATSFAKYLDGPIFEASKKREAMDLLAQRRRAYYV